MVSSQLSRNYWFYRLLFAIVRPFTKSLVSAELMFDWPLNNPTFSPFNDVQQQAAATTVYCATANELTGLSGLYYNNCFFCEPSKLSQSTALQQQLWQLSEHLVEDILQEKISETKWKSFFKYLYCLWFLYLYTFYNYASSFGVVFLFNLKSRTLNRDA